MTVATTRTGLQRPRGPVLGLPHLLQLRYHPIEHNEFLREAYGEVYRLYVFGVRMHVTAGADAAEQVLVNRDRSFANGPAWSHFIGPFFHRGIDAARLRRAPAPPADPPARLHQRRTAPLPRRDGAPRARGTGAVGRRREPSGCTTCSRRSPSTWRWRPSSGSTSTPAEQDAVNRAFIAAVRAGTSLLRKPVPGTPWAKGLKARTFLEGFFRSHIPAKRRDGGDDLFAQLCRAQGEDGAEFSDDDIVNHMIFLLMAAHDTTTITMSSMAYHLAKHPEWQERAREESLAAGDLDYDGALGLDVLDRVMKESLRLCAPVPSLPRVAVRDTSIQGYFIPAGSFVTVSPYMNHYLPELWPDPSVSTPTGSRPDGGRTGPTGWPSSRSAAACTSASGCTSPGCRCARSSTSCCAATAGRCPTTTCGRSTSPRCPSHATACRSGWSGCDRR